MKKFADLIRHIFRYPKYVSLFAMLFVAYVILLPRSGHGGDIWCWMQWTKYIQEHGLGNAYQSGTDYLPLFHYILWVFAKIQGSAEYIDRYINFLKIITLCFDFLAGCFLIKIINEKTRNIHQSVYLSMFFFLNMAYLYNTLIWNQVDGIMASLVFISFYFAIRKKILPGLLFFLLAVNFKLQAIIFFPFIGLILLPEMVNRFNYRRLASWILSLAVLQVLIVLPFVLAGNWVKLWNVVIDSFGKYPVVSMNAFNFWSWLISGDRMAVPDSLKFLGITYKSWGMYLFFFTSIWALLPVLLNSYRRIFRNSEEPIDKEKMFLAGALIPLLFFFLNTEMHERYLHPAILFLAAYSLTSKKYFPYILGSLAYLLNLEKVLQYWQLKNYNTGLFDPRFIAVLFFVCIVYCFIKMYSSQVKIQAEDRNILNR